MSCRDPKRDFAIEVVLRLKEAGHTALWAGGCVRDFLMNRQPQDYDVATSARPDQVRRLFGHRRTLTVGASFGVIIVQGPRSAGQLEVATFRTEGPYRDGRHPDHVTFSSPEEDAKRRDFTINGMFYDPIHQTVLDYVGGQADLERRIVRAIGNAKDRMQEDKLRMLRAVRFTAALDFQLDTATMATISELRREIHVVSAERIASELRRMLEDEHRKRAIELAQQLGLLTEIFPELRTVVECNDGDDTRDSVSHRSAAWSTTLDMLELLQNPRFELAMATLLFHVADAVDIRSLCQRLRLSNQQTDRIQWLCQHRDSLIAAPRLALADLKPILSHELCPDLLELARVAALATNGDLTSVDFCHEFLRKLPPEELDPPPLITGNDLRELNLKPGPHFRRLLQAVRNAQLNGTIKTREQAIQFVEQLQRPDKNDKK